MPSVSNETTNGIEQQKHATANRRDGWSAVPHMQLAKAAEKSNRKRIYLHPGLS